MASTSAQAYTHFADTKLVLPCVQANEYVWLIAQRDQIQKHE